MKINVIHHDKSHNMMADAENISYILRTLKEKPKVSHIHTNSNNIELATLNIFLENINMHHIGKAKYNIFIPSQHYFHKNWIEMCQCCDMVICKTKYCYEIFKDFINEEKLIYTGWRSSNLIIPPIEKEFDQYMVVYSDIFMNDLQKLINIWNIDYPVLNIVFNGIQSKKLKRINLANINYIDQITPEKFEQLFNKCIVHFCLDEIDCFNHNVNQCQLSKSVAVVINKGPVMEVVDPDNCFTVSSHKKKYKDGMGSIYKYTQDELEHIVKKIISMSDNTLEIMGKNACLYSEKKQNIFLDKMKAIFKQIFEKTKHIKLNTKEYSNEDLPSLSIITPVRNLKDIFRICVLNYTSTDYPKEKLEWIIVDDSDKNEDIEHLLPKKEQLKNFNITYIRLDEKTELGKKINMGVETGNNECVLIMNQDDFFYEKGFSNSVKELMKSQKNCVGMTKYGCFEINKYISIINVKIPLLEYCSKIYSGSLCFFKKFWEEQNFGENSNFIGSFFEERLDKFREILSNDILVGLIHTRNDDVREVRSKEPNGCHFNFSEKLFKYICSLDEHKKILEEQREEELEEIREKADKLNNETQGNAENSSKIKEI